MSDITTRTISVKNTADYQKVYELREEVLRKPIGLSLKDEDLSGDDLDKIIIAESGSELLGCVMIHPTHETTVLKLRQMAVQPSQQRKGIGQLLISVAENECRSAGATRIILHARIEAEGFYKKLGYATVSDIFNEVGIPHVVMEKPL
ncbi:GNAT family N-acetyltransferase [Polluticoccus soli]|uniref:GNAT family N-acetyltransferase n=1 Tax=Polluticoccus soli TaxID=3034150 RepID=UPI0023E19E08|nr:GNAT family N-acetyltransferase [Flavipsychrobacter sp. JY13-12]